MSRTIVPPARPARTDVDIPTVVSQIHDWLEHFQGDADKTTDPSDGSYYEGNVNMCEAVLGLLTKDDPNTVANATRRENLDNTYKVEFGPTTSTIWTSTRDHNLLFLRGVERNMNNLLRARHHVLVNDVLDDLGLPRTPTGAITGWLVRRDGIDFGLFDRDNPFNTTISTDEIIPITLHHHGVIYKEI